MSDRRKFESEEVDLKLLEVTEDPTSEHKIKKTPSIQSPAPARITVEGSSKKDRVLH